MSPNKPKSLVTDPKREFQIMAWLKLGIMSVTTSLYSPAPHKRRKWVVVSILVREGDVYDITKEIFDVITETNRIHFVQLTFYEHNKTIGLIKKIRQI